jgi:hypothetical protein
MEDDSGWTALWHAATRNHAAFCAALLQAPARTKQVRAL